MDITKLKVPDLKKELKSRGLSASGNKVELMERLQTALKSKLDDIASTESVEDLDEDLLNDEDDEHIDGTESEINDLDLPGEPTTPTQKSLKRKSIDSPPAEPNKQPKKIVLHRNISSTEEKKENETEESISPEKGSEEKKVIKLSELSVKERLEMRAKKFGVPLSGDAKKVARAERFSNTTTTKSTGSVSISACAAPTADVLKQRAERFGVSVSTALTKLENQERLEKRKERFGGVANGNTQADKAQQRLERFKQSV